LGVLSCVSAKNYYTELRGVGTEIHRGFLGFIGELWERMEGVESFELGVLSYAWLKLLHRVKRSRHRDSQRIFGVYWGAIERMES
jgi:hypothetical protein